MPESWEEASMATVQEPKRRRRNTVVPVPVDGEQHFRLSLIDYPSYVGVADLLGPRHIRATFADGELELMTLSREHEHIKTLLGAFIETLAVELDMDIEPGGSMTFRRADLQRGLEADECYWIANQAAMRKVKQVDLARDPPPDLALEIEISRSSLDRMAIYSRLRVPEVWRFDGKVVHFEILTKKGTYETRERSKSFPLLRSADLNRLLSGLPVEQSLTKVLRYIREWIREQNAANWKPQ
jgi:Uma2 family endonuclease